MVFYIRQRGDKMKEYSEQEQVRRNKVEEISKVCNPYPAKYERTLLM